MDWEEGYLRELRRGWNRRLEAGLRLRTREIGGTFFSSCYKYVYIYMYI